MELWTRIVQGRHNWAQLAIKGTILWPCEMLIQPLTNLVEMGAGRPCRDKSKSIIGRRKLRIDAGWGWAQGVLAVSLARQEVIIALPQRLSVSLKTRTCQSQCPNLLQITKQWPIRKTSRQAMKVRHFSEVSWMIHKVLTWVIVCQIASQSRLSSPYSLKAPKIIPILTIKMRQYLPI